MNAEDSSSSNNSSNIRYVDHFSLRTASTTVRFRHASVHIYGDTVEDQFLVEERGGVSSTDDPLAPPPQSPSSTTPSRRTKRQREHELLSGYYSPNQDRRVVLLVKHLQSNSFGLQVLRAAYTLVALLVFGFLIVFCFQIILFLVFNMLVDGMKNDDFAVVGAVLSVPMFLYSIAHVMCLGWSFVAETWSGHKLCRNLFQLPLAATEWLCFAVFLGLPAITMATNLLCGNNHWWEVTATIWVLGVGLFGLAFCFCVVLYEVQVCCKLIRIHHGIHHNYNHFLEEDQEWWQLGGHLLLHAVHVTQLYFLSGVRNEWYLVNGTDEEPPDVLARGYSSDPDCIPLETRMTLYSRLTELACCTGLYEHLPTPQRIYSMTEVRDTMPFLTRDNWSLETMFCRNHMRDPMIKVTGGTTRGALQPLQIRSTLICQILGSTLIVLLVVALISWMHMGLELVVFLSVLALVFCVYPLVHSSFLIHNSLQRHVQSVQQPQPCTNGAMEPAESAGAAKNDEEAALLTTSSVATELTYDSAQGASTGPSPSSNDPGSTTGTMLQVWESVRVTKPRIWLCYVLFVAEVGLLFIWPLWSLFNYGNVPVGVAFLFLGTFAFARLYFSAGAILTELGPLDDIPIPWDHWYGPSDRRRSDSDREASILREKSLISDVVGRISRGPAVVRWIWGYGFAVAMIFFMAYMAATAELSTTDYKVKGITLVPGKSFAYPARNESNGAVGNLPYPTCLLRKGFDFPSSSNGGEPSARMIDYAFLATMSYAGPDEAQGLLDAWFGPGQVKDEYEFVDQYRTETYSWGGVSYKLFSFSNHPGNGVVSIRGSEMMLDWLTNVELWSGASLLQTVRHIMPVGNIWTPVLHKMADLAYKLQSRNLREGAYYRRTTQFVNDVLKEKKFTALRVTGVSLGGGLAIITGAQSGASTVAISGPNAMISRKTFDPPVTVDQLNTRILNVIPDRDYIARIDDPGRLYQRIECRAPSYSLFGCHSMWRSLCEFAYQCGSDGRPILCWCVSKYGYPPPAPTENNTGFTWEEACANA